MFQIKFWLLLFILNFTSVILRVNNSGSRISIRKHYTYYIVLIRKVSGKITKQMHLDKNTLRSFLKKLG